MQHNVRIAQVHAVAGAKENAKAVVRPLVTRIVRGSQTFFLMDVRVQDAKGHVMGVEISVKDHVMEGVLVGQK